MYQKFKRQLLNEMEMRRDMIVLNSSGSSPEPLFEVSTSDDKLYRRILQEFDWIALRHVENLLCDLCAKYKIGVEKAGHTHFYDLKLSIAGMSYCIVLKSSPTAFNWDSYYRFTEHVQNYQHPVYLLYLLKDSPQSRNAVARHELRMQKNNPSNLRIMLFEDFLSEQFGVDELIRFKKAMMTYKDEMHQAVGYQITEIITPHNLAVLRRELEQNLLHFEYDRIRCARFTAIHSIDSNFGDLSNKNYSNIKDIFSEKNDISYYLETAALQNHFSHPSG